MYTGYNALNLALVVPENGRVVACEINEEYVKIAKPFFIEVNQSKTQSTKFAKLFKAAFPKSIVRQVDCGDHYHQCSLRSTYLTMLLGYTAQAHNSTF